MASDFLKRMASANNTNTVANRKSSDFLSAMAEQTRTRQQTYLAENTTPGKPVEPEKRNVFQKLFVDPVKDVYSTRPNYTLKDAWGNTSAKDIASSFFEGGFNQYMSGIHGLIGTADEFVTGLLPKGVKDALGIPDDYVSSASETADYYRQILEDDYRERTEGAGILGKKAVELSQSAGNMLASAGMGAVATGGITAPSTTAAEKLIDNAGLLSLSASAAGSGAQEAKAKGATVGQALAYGTLVGATEAVTEKLFGGNPLFDKSSGLVNRLISKITKNTKLLNFLASRPVEILNEGLEEMIAEIMAPVYERLTFNPNADFATLSEIIESAIDGIILSGVMQGGKAIVEAPFKAIQNRLENAKQAQPTPPQTSNIPATQPQSTQNDAIAQTDIPMPQEQLSQQRATESVTEPSIASISEMSKEDFKSNPPNGYKYKPSTSTTTQEADADTTNGVIYLTDKFFDLSPDSRKRVLAHELNHFKSEAITSNPENTELMQAIWGFTKSNPNTKYFVEKNVDEVVTELLTDYQENPEWLKEKHPQFYAIAENINNGILDVAQYGDLSKYIPTYKQYPNTPDGNSLQILDDVIATNPELAKQKGWDVKAEELRQKVFGEQPQNAQGVQPKQPKLPEGVGAMSKYPDVTNEQLIEQYGTVEKGKMPGVRDVDLAAQTEAGRTSKFAQTAAESGAVSDEVVQAIKQELPSGSYAYVPTPNKTALAHANETLASKGYETALADFQALMRSNQRVTVRDIVLGERLIQEASRRGDTETAARLIADVAVLGSEYGQTTQALNIIKRLSPEGQLMYLQRAVNRMNAKQAGKKLSADDYSELANLRQKLQEAESQLQESRSKGQNTDAATKAIENLKKQINKISGELYIPQSAIDDILAQRGKGEKALQEAMDRAYTAIAEQMPANWYDKWNAWRYMAMLTNPTTHIRNILGNAIFVPVRKLKNTIAAGMESAFNVKERTKAVLTAKDKPLVEFAKGDFAKVEDAITSTGKMNPSNIIRDRRRIFKSNTLETIRTKNSWLLEAEDAIFLRNAYADSLAQYMKANNLTPEFLSSGTEAAEVSLQKARAYAIQEAQKATYRDANAVAKWLNEAKRIKGLGVAIEGVVPFTKTPMNILRRGIEYSPIGLIKGLSYDLAQVKTGAKTATEAIDSIASGMSGTMIMGLGVWLASLGLISGGGSDNDKERAFSDLQGEQNYALQIGDTSYTIDWLAPVALPLFVGVELYNALKSDGLTAAETIEGLSRVADPMLNLTMLQGLNRAIRTAAYSGDNALGALAIESASSYVGQAVPTVLGKVARTIDPVRRDTSATNKDSILPGFVQKAINRNLAKIPFASKTLQPYVDAWGREQVSESVALRLFENFFSPGYISKKETTAVEDELMRLYRANSDRSVLPSLARSSFYDNGTQYTLTSEQFSQFKKTQGQTAYRLLEEAVSSEAYRSLSDDGKAKVVSDIYEYAREKAKEEYFDSRSIKIKRDTAKVVENADGAKKAGLDIVDFLATKLNLQNKKSEPARLYLLQRNDLTASQKAYLDKILIGERKNPIDYTSEESFYLSQLTENQRNKYARVKQLLGFTAEEYSKYLSVMGKADKKADKINALVEAGLSRQKAAQLYAILN